jgi:hypothetical protein
VGKPISKLTFAKESVRVLSAPELKKAAGGTATTWITCTDACPDTCDCRPSIQFACTTYLSCGGGCDTA